MSDRIRVDVAFAMVPEWLLYSEVSDRAVRLFAALARHADREWKAKPSRRRLAELLSCSVKSIDRAMEELIELGAVERQASFGSLGYQDVNHYVLRFSSGATPLSLGGDIPAGGGDTGVSPRGDTGVPQTREEPLPLSESVRSGSSVEENHALRGDLEGPSTTGGGNLATSHFVDSCRARGVEPTSRTIGQIAQQAGQLLGQGKSLADVALGIDLMLDKGRIVPSVLPNFVLEAELATNGNHRATPKRFNRGVTVADGIARTQSALENGR